MRDQISIMGVLLGRNVYDLAAGSFGKVFSKRYFTKCTKFDKERRSLNMKKL